MAKHKPSKSSGKLPITRHPLFPATVALWFGALFGIGSLAIRPTLIEALVLTLKIDAAIPSAAPPLGATGRILIALALAGLGGLIGAWLARRIAIPKPVAVQRNRGAGLSGAASGQPNGAASRRGRLALSDEGARRPDYLEAVPLPGGATILDVSQFDLDGFEAPRANEVSVIPEPATEHVPEPAEPQAAWQYQPAIERVPEGAQIFQPIASGLVEAEASFESESHATGFEALRSEMTREIGVAETTQSLSEPAESIPPRQIFSPFPAPADAEPGRVDVAPMDDQVPLDAEPTATDAPLPRLDDELGDRFEPVAPRARPGSIFDREPAPALFARPHNAQVSRLAWDNGALDPSAVPASEDAPAVPVDQPVDQEDVEISEAAAGPASERIASAPLEVLSPVELLERLALSMRRKRELAEASAPPVALEAEPEPSAETPVMAVASEEHASPPPVPVIPEALRPIGLDDEDDDDADHLPGYVPPRHFGQAEAGHDAFSRHAVDTELPEPPQSAPQEELEEGYSSLLSLSRPGAGPQRFVRIEEPQPASAEIEPVVVFPGHEPVTGEGPFARPADERRPAPADISANRRDPDETDRALRTALANIQRMSGAA